MRFLLLFILLLGFHFISTAQEVDMSEGKALYIDHKCNLCHDVASAGIKAKVKSDKMKGSDLSGYTFNRNVQTADYGSIMHKDVSVSEKRWQKMVKSFKGTDEELQAIVDWLGSLEAQE